MEIEVYEDSIILKPENAAESYYLGCIEAELWKQKAKINSGVYMDKWGLEIEFKKRR